MERMAAMRGPGFPGALPNWIQFLLPSATGPLIAVAGVARSSRAADPPWTAEVHEGAPRRG
jgi:hypothetical protein